MAEQGGTKLDFWRQTDIVTPDELPWVTMIGVGGIGSFTVLALAKMGCEHITIFDDDKVEDHNLPSQLYPIDSIGNDKVSAAQWVCNAFAGVEPMVYAAKFGEHSIPSSEVIISGVDSMRSRKEIWEKIKGNMRVKLYIDARMGAQVLRIHSINPNDKEQVEWYESTLYSDEEASEEPCTAKAIIYTGFAIASLVANQVKKFSKKEVVVKEIIFDLVTLTLITNE
jgi:molybdopterin/thiamine biosynthesis adenylyltransferase